MNAQTMSTDWIATTATGNVVHLMTAENAKAYRKAEARGSFRRPAPLCGQTTRRAYVAPRKPISEMDATWLANVPFCEKCAAASAEAER
jgi:hypothetical protein